MNYSSSLSAASSLGLAKDTLITGINSLVKTSTAVHSVSGNEPKMFALGQNYPNPFNPTTTIQYQIPIASNVSLKVYDMLGRDVAVLVNENKIAGYYTSTFDARNMPSGIYFYKMNAGNYSTVKKLILMK